MVPYQFPECPWAHLPRNPCWALHYLDFALALALWKFLFLWSLSTASASLLVLWGNAILWLPLALWGLPQPPDCSLPWLLSPFTGHPFHVMHSWGPISWGHFSWLETWLSCCGSQGWFLWALTPLTKISGSRICVFKLSAGFTILRDRTVFTLPDISLRKQEQDWVGEPEDYGSDSSMDQVCGKE